MWTSGRTPKPIPEFNSSSKSTCVRCLDGTSYSESHSKLMPEIHSNIKVHATTASNYGQQLTGLDYEVFTLLSITILDLDTIA
ncbi:hypothetical protein CHS0354_030450 [Potamilus streckersoni]|uniref:Uncharacterized protein n=1 Tax=Potamilus streckersoni TaxID=2493646 RepID=A0AAE0W5C2_9BIVA|nr:hypothetical protein CHS0354_030450 [Potamilus streckersoni]